MIWFGSLLALLGLYGLAIHLAGIHPGVRGPAHEPYDTRWIGGAGAVLVVSGLVLVGRALRARRRARNDAEAAREERRARTSERQRLR